MTHEEGYTDHTVTFNLALGTRGGTVGMWEEVEFPVRLFTLGNVHEDELYGYAEDILSACRYSFISDDDVLSNLQNIEEVWVGDAGVNDDVWAYVKVDETGRWPSEFQSGLRNLGWEGNGVFLGGRAVSPYKFEETMSPPVFKFRANRDEIEEGDWPEVESDEN